MSQVDAGQNLRPNRLAVPRGNELVQFTPLPLDSTSTYWSLLTSGEQRVATETATKRPVMTLVMAEKTILECLIDLRLARTVDEWRKLFERLERVKGVFFQSFSDEGIRESFLVPLQVRFILLGAEREEAERIAPELIDAVIRLRNVGKWSPPATRPPLGDDPNADIRVFFLNQSEFDAFQRQWDADAHAIRSSQKGWSKPYLDEELRAFHDDPPADPYLKARGPRIDRFTFAEPRASTIPCPTGFNRDAVDHATRHVQELLFVATFLLRPVSQAEPSNDVLLSMAQRFDILGQRLPTNWASPELRERMVRIRSTNFEVGDVVQLSIHKAVEELARRVWFAVRSAVGHVVDPCGKEHDRTMFGPLQWHEMARAIPRLRETATMLISALDSVGRQRLECELKREAAELRALAVPVEPHSGTQAGAVNDEGAKPKDNGAGEKKGAKPPADPFVPLTSWNDILAALNEPHAKPHWKNDESTRKKIRNMNQQHKGPIRLRKGKGTQPSVEKAALLTWWNGLREHYDARTDEENEEAQSATLTVNESYQHGKSGTVVPGIGGSEKQRREKKGKGRKEG
jgi:hypothetical protein